MISREWREVKETPSFSFFQNSVYKEQRDDEAPLEKLLEERPPTRGGLETFRYQPL
jgi:hypothetical protein